MHAAEGYARSTGKVGVVLVTSGPGATNAVTGLTDALMDSIPIVCLTGQVPTHLIGNDAFQEADTTGITRPCTKHNYLVKDVNQLARIVHEAFHVARSGRPGPVVIDLPKDILIGKGAYTRAGQGRAQELQPAPPGRSRPDRRGGRADGAGQAAGLLLRRRRHQFGAARLGAVDQARAHDRLPVHADLDGPRRVPGVAIRKFLGMLGMHGTYEANLRDARLRLMIAVGSRFDDRVTGKLAAFSPNSKKDPYRHRPVVDQQERARRRGRWSATWPTCSRTCWRCGRSRRSRPTARRWPRWWQQIEKWRARDCLRYEHSPTRSSSRNTRSSVSTRLTQGPRDVTSRPKSASTRCGRRSSSNSTSPTTG